MTQDLQKKVDRAIKILRMYDKPTPIEVSFSGGKDSEVILELTKMAGIPYRAIYKNTTIDPKGTIQHCKSKGVEVLQPTISFFDLIKKKGYPSRVSRFCCEKLKEYKVLDDAVQGIRRSESAKRAKNYSDNDPIICRNYGSKKNHTNVYLPILSWTDNDVKEFISERGIKCHPLYYDENGKFCVERRLGCVGCPLQSRGKRLQEFKKNPKYLRAWISAYKVYYERERESILEIL